MKGHEDKCTLELRDTETQKQWDIGQWNTRIYSYLVWTELIVQPVDEGETNILEEEEAVTDESQILQSLESKHKE